MNRVVHFDLPADDVQRAIAFYQEAFGWQAVKWDGPMEYWFLITGGDDEPGGINGAISARTEDDEGVTNTIGVEDVEAAIAAVEAAGGTILRGKGAVPGVGWFALAQDTEGNQFGMMQDDPSAAYSSGQGRVDASSAS